MSFYTELDALRAAHTLLVIHTYKYTCIHIIFSPSVYVTFDPTEYNVNEGGIAKLNLLRSGYLDGITVAIYQEQHLVMWIKTKWGMPATIATRLGQGVVAKMSTMTV